MIYQIKPVIGNKVKKSVVDYIKKDNWITEHKVTEKFEKKFAKIIGSKYALMTNSGSSANLLALRRVLCLRPGTMSTVVTGSFTL